MIGYQQGIMIASGCNTGGRFCVRNSDRWFCDAVQPVFGTKVYEQKAHGRPQFVVKSSRIKCPYFGDILDLQGFCRSYLEIHGVLDFLNSKNRKGETHKRLRLRIYGSEEILAFIGQILPAKAKKIQHIQNFIKGGYIGETCAVYYQSAAEIFEILKYISGEPQSVKTWDKWYNILKNWNIYNGGQDNIFCK